MRVVVEARPAGNLPSRRHPDLTLRFPECAPGETSPRRQHRAGVRRRCKRAAKLIRSSTKIAHDRQGRKVAGLGGPWPRLLLWIFACAALVVSLIVRADGLDDRVPGSALRATAPEALPETGFPMLGWIIQRGEAAAWSVKSGPRG